MNNKEEIDYQTQLLLEISKSDILRAFEYAISRIERLEKLLGESRVLFEEAMLDIQSKGSILAEIEEQCKKVLCDKSKALNPRLIISIIRR